MSAIDNAVKAVMSDPNVTFMSKEGWTPVKSKKFTVLLKDATIEIDHKAEKWLSSDEIRNDLFFFPTYKDSRVGDKEFYSHCKDCNTSHKIIHGSFLYRKVLSYSHSHKNFSMWKTNRFECPDCRPKVREELESKKASALSQIKKATTAEYLGRSKERLQKLQKFLDILDSHAPKMKCLEKPQIDCDASAFELFHDMGKMEKLSDEKLVEVSEHGETLLHFFTSPFNIDFVSKISNIVDVNAIDSSGKTALHLAAMRGDIVMVDLLERANADTSIRCMAGNGVLHYAVIGQNTEIVEKFAHLFFDNNKGMTPLEFAACAPSDEIRSILMPFYNKQFSLNIPLQTAAACGNLKATKNLISLGMKPEETQNEIHPAHVAARHGHMDIVLFYLATGISVNMKDSYDRTFLHYASSSHSDAMGTMLMAMGANINTFDKFGDTPMKVSCSDSFRQTLAEQEFVKTILTPALNFIDEEGEEDVDEIERVEQEYFDELCAEESRDRMYQEKMEELSDWDTDEIPENWDD